jgi:hypothetical protein
MEQTAVQQAIKEIAELWSSPSDTPTYTQIFNVLENKLEMEKQQIIDAYIECKREYIVRMDCYPPQFVADEAK